MTIITGSVQIAVEPLKIHTFSGERAERPHHEDLAMGEVDELDDAVDDGVADRDERVQRTER